MTDNDVLTYRHINRAFGAGISNHQIGYAFIHIHYALDPSIVRGCWVTPFVDWNTNVWSLLIG